MRDLPLKRLCNRPCEPPPSRTGTSPESVRFHCHSKVSVDKSPEVFRILLFTKSRGRDGESFLRTLADAGKFDLIIISGTWQSNFQVFINYDKIQITHIFETY